MKTVNLLPQWYTQQAHRQRLMRMHVAVMVCLGAGMCGALWAGRQVREADFAKRGRLAEQVKTIVDPSGDLKQAEAELHRLEERRLARKELGHTVPMSAVIQQLRNQMTPGMALSNFSIDVRSQPVKGSGFVGDPQNPPRYHDVAHLTVLGISPNDKKITDFIEDLSRNPLFAGVTLDFTRSSTLQMIPVRKFEIQLDMDLDPLVTGDAGSAVATAAPIAGESDE